MRVEHGFVVVAEKNGHRFFRSYHGTGDSAKRALRMTIDVDALSISEADVEFSPNGNMRQWKSTVPNAKVSGASDD